MVSEMKEDIKAYKPQFPQVQMVPTTAQAEEGKKWTMWEIEFSLKPSTPVI